MPRATTNKLYRTFVKGLITEAGPLTYPEDATIDESNCVLHIGGYRQRRLGIQIEPGGVGYAHTTIDPNRVAVVEFAWKSVSNISTLNFTVVQIGNMITFTDNSARPMSTTQKSFSIDLTPYNLTSLDVFNYPCQFASGKGYLFIVHPLMNPLVVEYTQATDMIQVDKVDITIRDFIGVNDGLANDEEPTTLSNEHKYNLMNQGWVDPQQTATTASIGNGVDFSGLPFQYYNNEFLQVGAMTAGPTTQVITDYYTAASRYPGNNKQWWVARDATTNAFKPSLLQTMYMGSSRAPRGHFVLNAFNRDRTAVSGVPSLPVETEVTRPNTVAFSGGRAWYGQGSTIYFSQIMTTKGKAGMCYQEADPTAESISDLVATDGGTVQIPEMAAVNRLLPLAGGILCFATNGVWFITGGAGGFSPLDFSIIKVSPTGTEAPMSVVHIQDANTDMVLYWARVGIIGLQQRYGTFGKMEGMFDTSIISQDTIQSWYNKIDPAYHPYVKANYDTSTNVVQWLFNSGDCPYLRQFDSVLNFDLTLKAFYPWKITSVSQGSGPYLTGVFETVNNTGLRMGFTKYMSFYNVGGIVYYSMCEENEDQFRDWGSVPYNSFIETGYELEDDAMRKKEATYVFTYLKRTDVYFQSDNPDGPNEALTSPQSSLLMTVKWDWANSPVSNKYSRQVECYKSTRPFILDNYSDSTLRPFDTGYPIVVTRHKVRGHGKAVQFRFENNAIGKDFVLYGWAVAYSGNTTP